MAIRTADGPRSGCPIDASLEVIGDRWSLLVLRDVMFGNVVRPSRSRDRPHRSLSDQANRLRPFNTWAPRRHVDGTSLRECDVGPGRARSLGWIVRPDRHEHRLGIKSPGRRTPCRRRERRAGGLSRVPVSTVYDWVPRGFHPRAHRFGRHLKFTIVDV
jgi:hypothetical protein